MDCVGSRKDEGNDRAWIAIAPPVRDQPPGVAQKQMEALSRNVNVKADDETRAMAAHAGVEDWEPAESLPER